MRFKTYLPKPYSQKQWILPPFQNEKPSQRLMHALENTLFLYNGLSKIQAEKTSNNHSNFRLEEIRLIGSGARHNKINSDLDFLLIAPDLDTESANYLKLSMQYILFCDRPKNEAIDIYLLNKNIYPKRANKNLLPFIGDLMEKYNPR